MTTPAGASASITVTPSRPDQEHRRSDDTKRPDEARKPVRTIVIGALRSAVRRCLASGRSLLVVGVVVAAALGFGVTWVLGPNAPGGVVAQAPPSLVSFHSQARPDVNLQFTISGNASQDLYPGRTSTIDLAFTNPSATRIRLPSGAIKITVTSPTMSCPVTPNFKVVRTFTTAITIPPHATRDSLADMKVPTASWPVISMVTTHVNQDACEGVILTLHYSASVTTTNSVTASTSGKGSGNNGSSSGSSTVPVHTATASSGSGLAFTGLDVALLVGLGGLLLLSGAGILLWLRRSGARR